MINFKKLQLSISEKYSFVGIKKQKRRLYFHLPKGFEEVIKDEYWEQDNVNEFEEKCNLFFLFYRIFENFKLICEERGHLNDKKIKSDRDTIVSREEGLEIEIETQENIFYSKVNPIGKILDAYDEPKILSLMYRLGKSETLDYSQLHRYLDRGIFLPNYAIYIDSMNLPRPHIRFESTDIVAMYCYLFCEIQAKLNRTVNPEIAALSEQFHQRYIGIEYGLFQEDRYEEVIDILKDTLDIIDRKTSFKDSDYWELYDAIELFLYGSLEDAEDGEIWGFNNFHSIWESMCLTHIAKQTSPENLLFLDCNFISRSLENSFQQSRKKFDFSKIFQFNSQNLYPDAVVVAQQYRNKYRGDNTINFTLQKNDAWNDYSYEIAFTHPEKDNILKIASFKTEKGIHTIEELRGFCPSTENTLTIKSRLPRSFYSFWKINTEKLKVKEVRLMYLLNHVFFLAIEEGISNTKDFESFLWNNSSELSNSKVISNYLFRDPQDPKKSWNCTKEDIKKLFFEFAYKVTSRYIEYPIQCSNSFFRIIDIKYLSVDYFHDVQNIETIKSRSIRKQFIYEYLIQKKLEKMNNFSEKTRILSDLWLPKYHTSLIFKTVLSSESFLRFTTVDFEELEKYYY
ncbi:MAG: hypothetical protein AAGA60_30685 [Cyanobacteria bacterium P01_E01_bin.42]